jgi:hypothetical protein
MGGILLILGAVVTPVELGAQSVDSTVAAINAAERAGDPMRAAELFAQVYTLTGFDPGALAGAALSAAAANDLNLAGSLLARAIGEGYLDSSFVVRIARDSSLAAARANPKWVAAVQEMNRRIARLDHPLRRELASLAARDQQNRTKVGDVIARVGRESAEGDSVMRALDAADAPLLARLRAIVSERGWPGRSLVADDGAHAAWLILQHAPADGQRAMRPRVRAAIAGGEGRLGDLALLEDRVRVADGRPQFYGSQMQWPASGGGAAVLDSLAIPACVDLRRSAMGLDPLADYLKRFGMTYTPPSAACVAASWSDALDRRDMSGRVVFGVNVLPEGLPLGTRALAQPVALTAGQSLRIHASVDATPDVTKRDVTWRSTNPFVANVDAAGMVTAIRSGQVIIVATATADGSAMGAVRVTVTGAAQNRRE